MNGDMIIDELPTGSVLVFVFTTLISWFFQLPGFILTYLLHGTHAGRFGSQAGLALTLIQWGLGTTVMGAFPISDDPPPPPPDGFGLGAAPPPPEPGRLPRPPESAFPGATAEGGIMGNMTMMNEGGGSSLADMQAAYTGHEWISFLLMTIGSSAVLSRPLREPSAAVSGLTTENTATGWFLLLTSMIGYFRVKRFELSVRASRTDPTSLSTEDIQRDVAFRRNLEDVFGINVVFDSPTAATLTPSHSPDARRQAGIVRAIEEARLQNDLRNAGLL